MVWPLARELGMGHARTDGALAAAEAWLTLMGGPLRCVCVRRCDSAAVSQQMIKTVEGLAA